MTGCFIVFEGGDGVGKSTQMRALVDSLTTRGHEVVSTHEPGGTTVGLAIRRILLDPTTGDLDARAEALLYAADKAHHLYQVVRPALARGAVVISDRYVDSMLAYQGAGRRLNLGEVEKIARWATGDLRPDLTVLLDMPHADAVGKIADQDRLEQAGDDFHAAVRRHFLELARADPERYLVLPARDSRASLARRILGRVLEVVGDVSG